MDFDGLIRFDRRGLLSLVLMDVLAPRGVTSPLTPLWKTRGPLARRPVGRRDGVRRRRPVSDGETGKRHG